MKAIEWQSFLQEQREQHNKVVFRATELANIASCSAASLQVALQRLIKRGILERYAIGRYGLPNAATIEDVVSSLDSSAYITGMYALYRYQLITQVPVEILCFTNRRHNKSRVRNTSCGRVIFVCTTGAVYLPPPAGSVIAGPEQALCDFIYNCRKRGLVANDLVTFRNLDSINLSQLKLSLIRYPQGVVNEVAHIISRSGGR